MRADWVECNIGSVTYIFPGIGFPKNIQGKKQGEFPFYKVGDISKNFLNNSRILNECDNYVDSIDISNISSKLVPRGTVVFAKIGEGLKLNRRAVTF